MSWVHAGPCHLDTEFLSAQRAQALSRMRKLSWPESMEGGIADSGQSTTGEDRRREGEGWVCEEGGAPWLSGGHCPHLGHVCLLESG